MDSCSHLIQCGVGESSGNVTFRIGVWTRELGIHYTISDRPTLLKLQFGTVNSICILFYIYTLTFRLPLAADEDFMFKTLNLTLMSTENITVFHGDT